MNLQQIFIQNLKRIRKGRGISQMDLAEMCDTSGNYIGEIEMGRRIPSFEKIEKIAFALKIFPHQLFMQDIDDPKELKTKTFLTDIPHNIKKEIISRLTAAIQNSINESFNADNY
ncbi:MAG: helix-turn-helix domain-containing protein [Spirochaetaceae bacterium]|nr:helix-turn-helix domain-containing protein [Spirochaetaceae bacterium]